LKLKPKDIRPVLFCSACVRSEALLQFSCAPVSCRQKRFGVVLSRCSFGFNFPSDKTTEQGTVTFIMELKICNISKKFGSKTALDDVSFSASSGQPLGLLGRNGAGKTTMMRIIMSIFLPDSGSVLLDGQPLSKCSCRLGYLPEERGLYERSPIDEQLIYIARLRGMGKNDAARACAFWLDRLGMSEHRKSRPQTLSKGNQQRIQLALALINDPDVVILDEPFSGLDPVNALQLRSVVTELAQQDKLIILSSHQMSTVENFCDHVVMLSSGHCALDASLSELRAASRTGMVRIRTSDDRAALSIASAYGEAVQGRDSLTVTLPDTGSQNALLRALCDASLEITLFEAAAPSLEELFVSVCGEASSSAQDNLPEPDKTGGAQA